MNVAPAPVETPAIAEGLSDSEAKQRLAADTEEELARIAPPTEPKKTKP